MNVNAFLQKDYENETAFRPKKTNPKQSQFRKAKIACQKIQPHPDTASTDLVLTKDAVESK